MKKFKYCQIDYSIYPSEEELNEVGEVGWELLSIEPFEKRFFNNELRNSYTRTIYKATFKKEVVCETLKKENEFEGLGRR